MMMKKMIFICFQEFKVEESSRFWEDWHWTFHKLDCDPAMVVNWIKLDILDKFDKFDKLDKLEILDLLHKWNM